MARRPHRTVGADCGLRSGFSVHSPVPRRQRAHGAFAHIAIALSRGHQNRTLCEPRKIVEESKQSYYSSLGASSNNWHDGAHDLAPWLEYWLGTLLRAYAEFEQRVSALQSARGAKTEMVLEAFERLPHSFRLAELERACPTVTRDRSSVVLNRLKSEARVEAIGRGAGALDEKVGRLLTNF